MFEWQKNFDADRLCFILGGLYKKFSKNYPAVFEQMGGKVGGFQNYKLHIFRIMCKFKSFYHFYFLILTIFQMRKFLVWF